MPIASIASTPKISVIIPAFNRCDMLKEAVDSVLSQTFDDFELIVVDDGSTDDTRKMLSEYGGSLKIIRQKNRGVSAARNTGIRASGSPLIAFLDSDDLWLPDKLASQAAFFETRPDALICQTEEIWIRNGVRVNPKNKHRKRSGMIFEPSLHLCLVSPSAVMMRRSLFDAVGLFDENLPACEDYDLWLRVSIRIPVHLVEEPLIRKRGGHDDQLSAAPGLDRYRIQSILNLLENQKLSRNLSEEQRKAAVAVMRKKCKIYGNGCARRGRKEEAAHFLGLAEKYEEKE